MIESWSGQLARMRDRWLAQPGVTSQAADEADTAAAELATARKAIPGLEKQLGSATAEVEAARAKLVETEAKVTRTHGAYDGVPTVEHLTAYETAQREQRVQKLLVEKRQQAEIQAADELEAMKATIDRLEGEIASSHLHATHARVTARVRELAAELSQLQADYTAAFEAAPWIGTGENFTAASKAAPAPYEVARAIGMLLGR